LEEDGLPFVNIVAHRQIVVYKSLSTQLTIQFQYMPEEITYLVSTRHGITENIQNPSTYRSWSHKLKSSGIGIAKATEPQKLSRTVWFSMLKEPQLSDTHLIKHPVSL
jgi:hypothetical protein